ncbi:MAG: LicD family protein [Methanomassiliicoccales archaeon]|nr:MAG: LicD family protein [Methanomassiliicoccales archaeon]
MDTIFVINEDLLNKIHQKELEILIEFDKICKKHGLKYFLFCGTLLGAVRHNGFIPWDDDLDLVMMRDDYEKLLKLPASELPPNISIISSKSHKNFPFYYSKMMNLNTKFVERSTSKLDIPKGIFIDIFPLDYAPINKYERYIYWKLVSIFGYIGLIKYIWVKNSSKYEGFANFISCLVPLPKILFQKGYSSILSRKKKEDLVIFSAWPFDDIDHISYPIEWFHKSIYIKFENLLFPIPEHYNEILTQLYGDYMKIPSINERISGHDIIQFQL